MKSNGLDIQPNRRAFISTLAAGAASIGLASLAPLQTQAFEQSALYTDPKSPDEWFASMKGKHRIVFDVPKPNEIMPFAWPRVFLLTNQATGSSEKECSVAVILRHNAIPYAFESKLWEKYKFGEVFKADDPATKAPALRNAFWQPKKGDFKVPGFGEVAIGINELQDSGVLFFVCDAAITVFSAAVAEGMKMDPAAVKKDWLASLLPNIHEVPSGVWAVGRAQEHGCAYCFAG
jgi:intracellular sulfur oxidation DsrE/DsrF family protein